MARTLGCFPVACLPPCYMFPMESAGFMLLLLFFQYYKSAGVQTEIYVLLVSLICVVISTSSFILDLLFLLLKKILK